MNEGKWIGLGGKIEPGETPDECLIREVQEEAGLLLTTYQLRGLVHFIDDDYAEDMYLYTSDSYQKINVSADSFDCNEGELSWIEKDKVFDLNLWEGDRYFLRKLINGESNFEMTLVYKNGQLQD